MALRTVTVKPSLGDYTSLAAAEAGERGNLVTLDRQLAIECYSMLDTAGVVMNTGWTTDATRYARIYTPASERHDGKRSPSKYRLEANAGTFSAVIECRVSYTRFEGLQLKHTANGAGWQNQAAVGVRLSDMIVYDCQREGYHLYSGDTTLNNCLALHNGLEGFGGSTGAGWFYNCAAVNNGARGFYKPNTSSNWVLTNCYSGSNTTADYANAGGTGAFTLTTCHSADATGNTQTAFSTSTGGYFTNVTAGTEDLRIGASSALKDTATNLSGDAHWVHPGGNVDIIGTARPQGAAWDVGAFEFAASTTPKQADDTGVGTDATSLVAAIPAPDTSGGTDAAALAAALSAADAALGNDSFSVVVPGAPSFSDLGAGTDAFSVSVKVTAAETGTATDTTTLQFSTTLVETGIGADVISATAALSVSEAAVGSDISLPPTAFISIGETPLATDTGGIASVSYILGEAGVGVDVFSRAQGLFLGTATGQGRIDPKYPRGRIESSLAGRIERPSRGSIERRTS